MPTTYTNLIQTKQLESTATTQYTAVGVIAIIDKMTITNTSSSNVTVSVYLVVSGQTPSNSNVILEDYTLPPDRTYICPEIVGHTVETNNSIATLCSASSAVTMLCSGREIS